MAMCLDKRTDPGNLGIFFLFQAPSIEEHGKELQAPQAVNEGAALKGQ